MGMVSEKNYIDEIIEPARDNVNFVTKLLGMTEGSIGCKFTFVKVNSKYEKITDDLCVSECGYFALIEDFNEGSKSLIFLKDLEPSVAPSRYSDEAISIYWKAIESYKKSIQRNLMIHLNIQVERKDMSAEEMAEYLINEGLISVKDLILAEYTN